MENYIYYSSRLLHHELQIQTQYTKWLQRVIERINNMNVKRKEDNKVYQKNTDYFKIQTLQKTRNPKNPNTIQTDYIITHQLRIAISNLEHPHL